MIVRIFTAGVALAMFVSSGAAQAVGNFCGSTRERLGHDFALSSAASVVFPQSKYAGEDDECIYPVKLLRYGDADVLVTAGNAPGAVCHGCTTSLSAYVLSRTPERARVVARFIDFTKSGTFGDAGLIDPVQLAGDDAFAIEAGGAFQGYESSTVSFFAFRGGRLQELKPSLPLTASNAGAMTDDQKAVEVTGAWHIDPKQSDAVTVDYKVVARGRTRTTKATWRLEGSKLELRSGAVPPEYHEAGGG